ncbi:TIGR04222 domain-containing membrane protein [Actinoplanes rectilineatus]|uniref:TIGR04222 domain-containing membrane protein n=1 Tax=Actinoplanes rectilineatus TaxID=113571 RepID=UPI0005F296A8|nr:TIGR04222 domain-containing membrane protein [Actinoplanes rectilineatus]
MGTLAWLAAVAGIGAGSLAFAVAAPDVARWVLGLILIGLLLGPHVLQWWLRRATRTARAAARWWARGPSAAEVAFLCGGPDRVVDLTVADLVAERHVIVDDDGRLTVASAAPGATGLRAEVLDRLAHGSTDLAGLRFAARSPAALPQLWGTAAGHGLLLPAWHRQYPQVYVAGAIAATGYALATTLPGLTFVLGTGALLLGILAVARTRYLTGYGFDPRTAAGLRATALALDAAATGEPRYRIAARGLRSVADLRPGATDPHPVPPSTWHVPWYAPRVGEPRIRWWRSPAQSTVPAPRR